MVIAITAIGAVTPVGYNAEQTCTSIRAGIARITEHAFYTCLSNREDAEVLEPLFVASVPGIDPFATGKDRLVSLVLSALGDLLKKAKIRRGDLRNTGFFLALPQNDPAVDAFRLQDGFVEQLLRRSGLPSFSEIHVSQHGHVGVFRLLADAVERVQSGTIEKAIIGGVDSYLFEQRLAYLDGQWRIKSERNIDGFVPGEASAMFLVERFDRVGDPDDHPVLEIGQFGFGEEPDTFLSDRQSSGVGLSQTISQTLGSHDGAVEYSWVNCDMNGESYRAYEWGVVQTRLHQVFGNLRKLAHPADCIGDVGAASGAILIANAFQSFKRGYHSADRALLWTASDGSQRAAMTVIGRRR